MPEYLNFILSIIATTIALCSIAWQIVIHRRSFVSNLKYSLVSIEKFSSKIEKNHPVFSSERNIWLMIRNLSHRPSVVLTIDGYVIGKSQIRFIDRPISVSPWSVEKICLDIDYDSRLPRFLVMEELDGLFSVINFFGFNDELIFSEEKHFKKNDDASVYCETCWNKLVSKQKEITKK
jgi:hypothetical protein